MTMQLFRSDAPRLTAADVADAAADLPRTPTLHRGLDPGAVDKLLGQVQTELEMLAAERADRDQRVAELEARILNRDGPGALAVNEGEGLEIARKIVAEGQLTAESDIQAAREYCARLVADARRHREDLLSEAERVRDEAERVLADAKTEARDAAMVAWDAPVPDQAAGPLRAARAADAYGRRLNQVGLGGAVAVGEALLKMLVDLKMLNELTEPDTGDERTEPVRERAR